MYCIKMMWQHVLYTEFRSLQDQGKLECSVIASHMIQIIAQMAYHYLKGINFMGDLPFLLSGKLWIPCSVNSFGGSNR